MSCRLIVAGALALALCACGQQPRQAPGTARPTGPAADRGPALSPGSVAGASRPPSLSTTRFIGSYTRPESRKLAGAAMLMRHNHLVEDWTKSANDAFVTPIDVRIKGAECGAVNAFYDPDTKSVTMCYEMVADLRALFAKPAAGAAAPDPGHVNDRVIGALNGIFFHELGHGLIDLYDLPTTGREEDAVDQLSALVLIRSAEHDHDYRAITSTLETWRKLSEESESGPLRRGAFADDHSLSGQRYFNLMCYLYGSNHNEFLSLVAEKQLPVRRAARCEVEYDKMSRAWTRLLGPHLRPEVPVPSGPNASG
jgi:hypothetical protein